MENPLIRSLLEREKQKRLIAEAFEMWFQSRVPEINPMLSKEDCKTIFNEAFELGILHSLSLFLEGFGKNQ